MRKSRKQKSPLKKILLIVALAVLIGLVYGIVAANAKWWPFTVTTSTPTSSEETPTNATKDGMVVPSDEDSKTTDQIPVASELTATITDLSQSGGFVSFSGTVNSTDASGKCSFTLTNANDKPVSRTVETVIKDGVASCGPVRISETEFAYVGEWTGTFRYHTNGAQAVSSRSIVIK